MTDLKATHDLAASCRPSAEQGGIKVDIGSQIDVVYTKGVGFHLTVDGTSYHLHTNMHGNGGLWYSVGDKPHSRDMTREEVITAIAAIMTISSRYERAVFRPVFDRMLTNLPSLTLAETPILGAEKPAARTENARDWTWSLV